jgi:hypothetical protein
VRAPAGVDVMVIYDEQDAKPPTDREGPGREEEFSLPAHAGQPVIIGVTRKPIAPGTAKTEGVPGLEEPYELRSELEAAKP